MPLTTNQVLLRDFNHARAVNDAGFISGHVTDDIRWQIVGECTIEGKRAFSEAIQERASDDLQHVRITHIIIDGDEGVVHGTLSGTGRNGKKQAFAFCDVYQLSGSPDPKIREITSYSIPIDPA